MRLPLTLSTLTMADLDSFRIPAWQGLAPDTFSILRSTRSAWGSERWLQPAMRPVRRQFHG